jgi:hypothetical protein
MGRLLASWVCLILAAMSLITGAVSYVAARNLFDSRVFGERAARSLRDPKVAAFVSDQITDALIKSRPDLIAFRPLIQSSATGLVSSRAFQGVVAPAARQLHEAAFSQEASRVVLALPDLQILIRETLKQASPEIADKIPPNVEIALAKISEGRNGQYLLKLSRVGNNLRWLWRALLPTSLLFFVLSLMISRQRQRGMVRIGIALLIVGLLTAAFLPAGGLAVRSISNELERGFARGLWRTYLGDLARWALLFGALGVILLAGATSRLESWNPLTLAQRGGRFLTNPPSDDRGRLVWGSTLVVTGVLAALFTQYAVLWAVALSGAGAAFIGTRELFRLFLERFAITHAQSELAAEPVSAVPAQTQGKTRAAGVALIALCLLFGAVAWYFFFRSSSSVVPIETAEPDFCNGYAELCDKHLDQVAFAGTHNSMSNQDMPGWLFPQQEASIPHQLVDGVRALLIDVHYGFPGGSRIKTDLSAEKNTEKIREVVGEEGLAATMRIRTSLVGVDTGHRGLYLCHGFCELGSYALEPAFREIRAFLVTHPDEVIILDIEDYVKPEDLAHVFETSRLLDFAYKGPTGPPWPTLREAISSGQRVFAFIESGLPGVSWLPPAYPTMRETPYSFHTPAEFSCIANRGGDAGSLFLMNNWVETTPTPKPSNAAIVNAYPFLVKRAEECAAERNHMVNIVAVDFYRTGDLLRVVNHINGISEGDVTSTPPAAPAASVP